MTVHTFALSSLETGGLLAIALVAPDARYCSLTTSRAARVQRQYPSPKKWRAIEAELRPGLDGGLLPADSAVVRAFDASRNLAIRYLSAMDVDVPTVGAADVLDRLLMEQAEVFSRQ